MQTILGGLIIQTQDQGWFAVQPGGCLERLGRSYEEEGVDTGAIRQEGPG